MSRQVSKVRRACWGGSACSFNARQVSPWLNLATCTNNCKDLVIGLQQANEQVTSQQTQLAAHCVSVLRAHLPRIMLRQRWWSLQKSHPDLTIEMNFNARWWTLLNDFAIRYGRLDDSGLVARKLVDRPMAAAAWEQSVYRSIWRARSSGNS